MLVVDYFGYGQRWICTSSTFERANCWEHQALSIRPNRSLREGGFLVIYADSQSTCGLNDIIQFYSGRHSVATMSVCWVEDPRSCGLVGFDDHCRIQRFLEKPTAEQVFSRYINAGIYVFEPEVFDYIPAKGVSDFSRDVFPRMLAAGALLYAFLFDCYALKFDTFEDWRTSEALIAEKRKLGPVRFLPRHGTHEKRHGVNKCGSSDRRIVATNSA